MNDFKDDKNKVKQYIDALNQDLDTAMNVNQE